MKHTIMFIGSICLILACASASSVYVLDPPNNNMRASEQSQDKPLSDCNPEKLPSGELQYKCVGLFNADYGALLKQISDLQSQLKACQQGH